MKKYQILIPELVPLDNRGEEAIVRGIADVLFPDGSCEIHLFDEVENYQYINGIHVYPVKWFISPWLNREFGLGLNWEKLRDSGFSITRNLLHKIWPRWVKYKCVPLRRTAKIWSRLASGGEAVSDKEACLKQLLNCDYIVAGHDGALDDRVCQVIDVLLGFGKRFGVFGVEFPMSFKSKQLVEVKKRVLEQAEFFYCRTEASYKVTQKYFPSIKSEVLADPAFGMIPAKGSIVDEIIKRNDLLELFQKPVVMCTSCEPPPISRYCFEDTTAPDKKLAVHRELFAQLIKHIAESYDVNILFLPHAIGPGKALDDRIIAKDILERSRLPKERACILNDLLSGKELKGLIGRSEFMVAERIHSMIGSVGVGTPFLCLGSKTDRRIKGIICEMLDLGDVVYYLNRPELKSLTNKFDEVWSDRVGLKNRLKECYQFMSLRLEEKAKIMRSYIEI